AVEKLFLCIDAEPILAGAFRTRTAALDPAPSLIPRRAISSSMGTDRALTPHRSHCSEAIASPPRAFVDQRAQGGEVAKCQRNDSGRPVVGERATDLA